MPPPTRAGDWSGSSLEPARREPSSPREMLVRMRTWPGGDEQTLGTAVTAHGLPVVWD